MADPIISITSDDNGESWHADLVFAGHLTEDEVEAACYANGFESHYGGPGQGFCGRPGCNRTDREGLLSMIDLPDPTPAQRAAIEGHDAFTLISCSGGLDI